MHCRNTRYGCIYLSGQHRMKVRGNKTVPQFFTPVFCIPVKKQQQLRVIFSTTYYNPSIESLRYPKGPDVAYTLRPDNSLQ